MLSRATVVRVTLFVFYNTRFFTDTILGPKNGSSGPPCGDDEPVAGERAAITCRSVFTVYLFERARKGPSTTAYLGQRQRPPPSVCCCCLRNGGERVDPRAFCNISSVDEFSVTDRRAHVLLLAVSAVHVPFVLYGRLRLGITRAAVRYYNRKYRMYGLIFITRVTVNWRLSVSSEFPGRTYNDVVLTLHVFNRDWYDVSFLSCSVRMYNILDCRYRLMGTMHCRRNDL